MNVQPNTYQFFLVAGKQPPKKCDRLEKKCVNYYPFGLKHKGYNNVTSPNGNSVAQKFGYNGKQHQDELNLGWIDLGARNLDPTIGRFINIDPVADFVNYQSPYAVADNNPIFYIDIDGLKSKRNFFQRLWNRIFTRGERSRFPRRAKRLKSRRGRLPSSKKNKRKKSSSSSSNNTLSLIPRISNIQSLGFTRLGNPKIEDNIILSPRRLGDLIGPEGLEVPNELQFGNLTIFTSARGITTMRRENVQLGNDDGTRKTLTLIARILKRNPLIRMSITFLDPDDDRNNLETSRAKSIVSDWNRRKFQSLARRLKNDHGIDPTRLIYIEQRQGGRIIFRR
jgi:RHS repeat-associated protein